MMKRGGWLGILILTAALAGEHPAGWGYAPDEWTATSGVENGPAVAAESLPLAFDREADTRWTTGRDMQPGDWFALDLGHRVTVGRILLDAGTSRRDFPRRVKLEVDDGGEGWVEVQGAEVLVGDDGDCRLTFEPREAQRLRFTNLGRAAGLWWSIHEVYVWAK